MMEAILILGGGADQLPAVHAVNRLGLISVVADINPSCLASSYADYFINVSSKDVDNIIQALSKIEGIKIATVFVIGTDIPYIGSRIANKLGSWYPISLELAELSVDKFELKNILRQNGFSTPAVSKLNKSGGTDINFPCIVKPNLLAGSRGVHYVRSSAEFTSKIEEIKLNFPGSDILIEEFVDGIQISSEHIISRGEVFTHGLALRNYEDTAVLLPSIIENGGIQCHPLAMTYLKLIEIEVKRLVALFKIDSSVLKFDLIINEGRVFILEMAVRMSGGGFASAIIPYSLGFDYIRNSLGTLLGNEDSRDVLSRYSLTRNTKFEFVANRYLIAKRPFEYEKFEWATELYIENALYVKSGDLCLRPKHHGERTGVFVLKDKDLNSLKLRIDNVYKKSKVNGAPVNDFFCYLDSGSLEQVAKI
jgi:biotin carboxylase